MQVVPSLKDTRDDLRVMISDSFQYGVEMQGYEDTLNGVDKCGGHLLGSHDTHSWASLVRQCQQQTMAAVSL